MTQTGLPRRPFAEVPPPPGGLEDVRRVARFRRRRRAAIAAGGGSVAVVVVTLALLLGGGGGVDVLKTVQPAVTPAPGTTTAIPAPSQPRTGLAPVVDGNVSAAPGQVAPAPGVGAPASAQAANQPPTANQQPQLVRTRRTDTSGVRFCGESASVGSGAETETTLGWCLAAVVHRVGTGEQLTVDLCRDSAGGGTLTFETTREVDLTVQRGGKTVWDWAHDHPAVGDPHQLSAATHGCWDWSLVWPDVAQSGAAAGHGTFTFIATSTAKELAAVGPVSTTFRL